MNGLKSIPDLRWASPLEMKNATERVFAEKFGAKGSAAPKAKVCEIPYSYCHRALIPSRNLRRLLQRANRKQRQ
jgi:hypothetical protein